MQLAPHKAALEGSDGEKVINALAAVLGAHAPPARMVALLAGRGRLVDVAAFKTISKRKDVLTLAEDVDHRSVDFSKAVEHALMTTKVSSLFSSYVRYLV